MSKHTNPSDGEFIFQPKTRELPCASVDLLEVLSSCFNEDLTVEAAQQQCVARGAPLMIADVEKAYAKLSEDAKWWNDLLMPYSQSKAEKR